MKKHLINKIMAKKLDPIIVLFVSHSIFWNYDLLNTNCRLTKNQVFESQVVEARFFSYYIDFLPFFTYKIHLLS